MDTPAYEKRGYLNEEYRLFAISENGLPELNYHYHEFHKLIFIKDGKAGYSIEGRYFDLKKNDIVIVPAGCVHRPEIEGGELYSRYVLYVSPELLKDYSTADTDLSSCFAGNGGAVRLGGETLVNVQKLFYEIDISDANAFGSDIMCRSLILQLMVILGRWLREPFVSVEGIANDKKILKILEYINENINEELSIDALAERFYISKFHMMRRFRDETGYTVHNYVTNKRLLYAKQMISGGESATDVCFKCGFRDYSTFSRAYRKQFGVSPSGRKKKTGEE